ncbi:hypothetical protein C8R45DRAFT_1081294 [Mycena sanguinolenta]|nr:hypothetical protein C8R45DRAFT_1081294 [Mycena sanguinolenta]
MHPSLDVANFSKLPPNLKSLAVAAASGSEHETLTLVDNLSTSAPKHLSFLSPAFYSSLDPVRIDMVLSRFDSAGWQSVAADIIQVHACMAAIGRLTAHKFIPPDALVDLWERVWPWIRFLDEYEESLSGDALASPETRYKRSLSLIRVLRSNPSAQKLIDSTKGLWIVVGRGWRHLVHEGDNIILATISYFLATWPREPHLEAIALEELILGAGGSLTDLASLAVSHIKRSLPYPNSPVDEPAIMQILSIIRIFGPEDGKEPDPLLYAALLSCRVVPALTTAVRALCRSTVFHAGNTLYVLLSTLMQLIAMFPLTRLRESLHAGLLEILFNPVQREVISPCMIDLLVDVVFPATVYQSVLKKLQDFLPQVRDRDAAAIFCDTNLLAHWTRLLKVVESRSKIADKYLTGVLTVPRICEDLECARTCSRQDLNCCGGCLNAYYCSPTCQVNDWRRGGHREICRDLFVRRQQLAHIPSGDRTILRAFIHYEYMTQREEIERKHRRFVESGSCEVPAILFDFVTGFCHVEVGVLPDASPFDLDGDRARRGGGKIQLHLVKVMDGSQSRMWPFYTHMHFDSVAELETVGKARPGTL